MKLKRVRAALLALIMASAMLVVIVVTGSSAANALTWPCQQPTAQPYQIGRGTSFGTAGNVGGIYVQVQYAADLVDLGFSGYHSTDACPPTGNGGTNSSNVTYSGVSYYDAAGHSLFIGEGLYAGKSCPANQMYLAWDVNGAWHYDQCISETVEHSFQISWEGPGTGKADLIADDSVFATESLSGWSGADNVKVIEGNAWSRDDNIMGDPSHPAEFYALQLENSSALWCSNTAGCGSVPANSATPQTYITSPWSSRYSMSTPNGNSWYPSTVS